MKNYFLISTLALLFLSSCDTENKKSETNIIKDSTNTEVKKIPDSTKTVDTIKPIIKDEKDDKTNSNNTTPKDDFVGKHSLTLHWLGWDKPGVATIKKLDSVWCSIKGEHKSSRGILTIDGKIKKETPERLLFEGKIITRDQYTYDNKPCERNGYQVFLSTKNRKYWRMQGMINCDGATTDYVDLYY